MSNLSERLGLVNEITLSVGAHASFDDGACLMEVVSWVAGESWSDHPACVCPVISAFLRGWNDVLPDDERTTLLRPLIPRLIGTRTTPEIEQRRATMAADWLIRSYTPAWLHLVGLTAHADALASLPGDHRLSPMPVVNANVGGSKSRCSCGQGCGLGCSQPNAT